MDYKATFDGMFGADFSADHSALKDAISSLSDIVRSTYDKRTVLDALIRSQSFAFELTFCDNAKWSAELRSYVVRDLSASPFISSFQHELFARLGRFIASLPPTIHLSSNAFRVWADACKVLALDKELTPSDPPSLISPTGSKRSKHPARRDSKPISPMLKDLLSATDMSSMKIQTSSDIMHVRKTLCSRAAKTVEIVLFALSNIEVQTHIHKRLLLPRQVDPTIALASHEATEQSQDVIDDRDQNPETCNRPNTAAVRQTVDGVWPVLIASKALIFFKRPRGDPTITQMVQRKIEELASGAFTKSNYVHLLKQHFPIPLLKAKASKSLRIIYQIDCDYPVPNREDGEPLESQCIRVYDICNVEDVDYGLWTSVAKELARRGTHYQSKCKPQRAAGSAVVLPTTFPRHSLGEAWAKSVETSSEAEPIDESQFLELHRILAVEKFIVFRKSLVEEARQDPNRDYQFALHPSEYDIMTHDSSCLVLGRSGTGKTTTMMFKMIEVEATGVAMGIHHRQVFVTQSATLARKVGEYYGQLVTGTGASTSQNHESSPPKTSSLMDLDENSAGQDELPSRFGDLKPEQFPLFITFDQLRRLLEGDVIAYALDLQKKGKKVPPEVRLVQVQASRSRLTFHRFESVVWPRLARKGLSPAMVFNEFVGVIKGSEETLATSAGYLTRHAYEELSSRRASTFAENRNEVYSLFETYRKIKPHEYRDDADRTRSLLDALQYPVPLLPIDFLYVDEVQDNLIIDVALLRRLCRNPHGMFLAGDTAQTISVGNSFRFNDMKALIYRLERKDPTVESGLRKPVDPKFFQLSVNYRSHGGIVDTAAFFVHLMTKLFPGCVDILNRETAKVAGRHRRPTFFSKRQEKGDLMRLISDEDTGVAGLGSNQVIIVRDSDAASRLSKLIGDIAIILTIYESKGMEFDDVLLYDFFADSAAGSTDWRALIRSISWTADHVPVVGDFDRSRHAILESELKCLYVAFTRARERVYIWETSDHAREMETLVCKAELCLAIDPAQPVPQIARTTSCEEWNERGRAYFSKCLYTQAATCFQKAKARWWEEIANAYAVEQAAMRLRLGDPARLTKLLGAGCEFKRLASLPGTPASDAKVLFQHAGDCYHIAEKFDMAARCFLSSDRFEDAAVNFRHAGLFDNLLDVILQHEEQIGKLVLETIKNAARVEFVKGNQLEKAKKLFGTLQEFLEFLQDPRFEHQLAVFLQTESMFDELGELRRTQGNLSEAVRFFLQAELPSSQTKAASCLIDAFRASLPFPLPFPLPAVIQELARLSGLVPRDVFESSKLMDEIDLFVAISGPYKRDQMLELATRFLSQGNVRCSLLAFDAWERLNPQEVLDNTNSDLRILRLLKAYRWFGGAVRAACDRRTFLNDSATLTFYGLKGGEDLGTSRGSPDQTTTGSSEVVVTPPSFIFHTVLRQAPTPTSGSNLQPDLRVPVETAEELIRWRHAVEFNNVLDRLHQRARRSPAFSICPHFLVNGFCGREKPCPGRHVVFNKLALNDLHECFNLHLHLIFVLDNYAVAPEDNQDKGRVAMQSNRLGQLFELFYPVTGGLLSFSDLKMASMPDLAETLPTLKAWVQEVLAAQWPVKSESTRFLTNLLQSSLLASLIDYDDFMSAVKPGKEVPTVSLALQWFDWKCANRHGSGVRFSAYAVQETPALDVVTLVGLVEEIGAQLIWNGYCHLGGVDGLTLPASWLLRVQQRGSSSEPNGNALTVFAVDITTLLQILFGQVPSGQLMLGGSPLKQDGVQDKFTRSQCVSRLCRLLVLLGINSSRNLRSIIWNCLDGVIQGDNPLELDDPSYFSAATWGGLARVAASSLDLTPFDEMVVILEPDSPRVKQSVPGVRVIIAKTVQELRTKLCPDPDSLLALGTSTVPTVVAPSGGFTEEEKKAVQVMEKHYCRRIVRAREGPLYDAYDKMARSLEAKKGDGIRRYCVYLRGPMPYVLDYLETLALKCQEVLRDAETQIAQPDRGDLDRLLKRRQTAQRLENDIHVISTKLHPTSPFHELASIPKLVKAVRSIPGLCDRLAKLHRAFHDKKTYDLGVKRILDRNIST